METTTTRFTIGFKTHIGKVREMNQDSYAILRRAELLGLLDGLLVVADGMGGGKGGEIASRIVAETLPNVAHEELAEVLGGRKLDVKNILRIGMERANANVRHKGVEQSDLRGMGTTCVAAILNDGVLTVGNAGDSRVYLLRNGELRQVTDDHSEVWQQVLEGKMTREEAQKSKFRNRITKAIGLFNEVRPEIDTFTLQEGDTVLLCTDGLTTEVLDAEIARILASAPDAQSACDKLTDAALRKGGSDNITTVCLRYGEFTPMAGVAIQPEPIAVEEEEATDERAEWRQSQRQSQTVSAVADFSAPYEDDEPEYDPEEREEREERPRRKGKNYVDEEEQAAKNGGFATILIVTLLCLCAALGIALGVAMSNRTIVVPAVSKVVDNQTGLTVRTDKDLIYFDPVVVYDKPVRDDVLLINSFDEIVVAGADGKLIGITPPDPNKPEKGLDLNAQPFHFRTLPDPPLPPSPKTETAVKSKPAILVAFDPSLNRYQNDPDTKCIFKYDSSGIRKLTNIGLKRVIALTRMVVDKQGDVYIIDGHELKRIQAHESTDQIREDNENVKKGIKVTH